jgi:hypothetical protein
MADSRDRAGLRSHSGRRSERPSAWETGISAVSSWHLPCQWRRYRGIQLLQYDPVAHPVSAGTRPGIPLARDKREPAEGALE